MYEQNAQIEQEEVSHTWATQAIDGDHREFAVRMASSEFEARSTAVDFSKRRENGRVRLFRDRQIVSLYVDGIETSPGVN